MKRLLFLLLPLFAFHTSCTKEEVKIEESETLESQLEELKLIQEQMFSELLPLQRLSIDELQSIGTTGTDVIKDLKKYYPINDNELLKKVLLLIKKVEQIKKLGVKESEIVALLTGKIRAKFGIDLTQSIMATPCYDSYEIAVGAAEAEAAICTTSAIFDFSPGSAIGCMASYAKDMTTAKKSYDACMRSTY